MNFLQQYPSLNIRKKSHKAQTIIFFEGGERGCWVISKKNSVKYKLLTKQKCEREAMGKCL